MWKKNWWILHEMINDWCGRRIDEYDMKWLMIDERRKWIQYEIVND